MKRRPAKPQPSVLSPRAREILDRMQLVRFAQQLDGYLPRWQAARR